MEQSEILDNKNSQPNHKKFWSIRLLLVATSIMVATFVIGVFWQKIGISQENLIWLGVSFMIAFGVNIAELILGFLETNRNLFKALVRIIGNFLEIVIFISLIVYSLFLKA